MNSCLEITEGEVDGGVIAFERADFANDDVVLEGVRAGDDVGGDEGEGSGVSEVAPESAVETTDEVVSEGVGSTMATFHLKGMGWGAKVSRCVKKNAPKTSVE